MCIVANTSLSTWLYNTFIIPLSLVFIRLFLRLSAYSRSDLAEEVSGITSADNTVRVSLAQVLLHTDIVLGLVGFDVGLGEEEWAKINRGCEEDWTMIWSHEGKIWSWTKEDKMRETIDHMNANSGTALDIPKPDLYWPRLTLSIVVAATAASATGSEEPRLRASKERWEKLVRRASRRVTTRPNSCVGESEGRIFREMSGFELGYNFRNDKYL